MSTAKRNNCLPMRASCSRALRAVMLVDTVDTLAFSAARRRAANRERLQKIQEGFAHNQQK